MGIGIYVLYLGDGDHHDNRLVISGNEIRNTGHTSVVVSAAYGTTVIERNVLVPGGDNVRIGQGMFVREAGYFGEGNPALAKTTITNNTIIIDNDSAALWLDFATDAEITGNHIVMNNGMWASGIALLDGSTNSLVADNKIEGSANGAFALGYNWVAAPVEHNVYRGNNVSNFTPVDCPLAPGAHYALLPGANQNLVVGNGGQVIDLGEDNIITGLTKKPGNIGQMIKAVK